MSLAVGWLSLAAAVAYLALAALVGMELLRSAAAAASRSSARHSCS
jgi:hypothetical protein